jgi:hypothetical protein
MRWCLCTVERPAGGLDSREIDGLPPAVLLVACGGVNVPAVAGWSRSCLCFSLEHRQRAENDEHEAHHLHV